MIGWTLFAGESLGAAVQYLGLMFGIGGKGLADREAFYLLKSDWVVWIVLILASTPVLHNSYRRIMRKLGKKKAVVNVLVYGILFMICVAFLVTETYNPFLYFRF